MGFTSSVQYSFGLCWVETALSWPALYLSHPNKLPLTMPATPLWMTVLGECVGKDTLQSEKSIGKEIRGKQCWVMKEQGIKKDSSAPISRNNSEITFQAIHFVRMTYSGFFFSYHIMCTDLYRWVMYIFVPLRYWSVICF